MYLNLTDNFLKTYLILINLYCSRADSEKRSMDFFKGFDQFY
jgi:hypothetical protein